MDDSIWIIFTRKGVVGMRKAQRRNVARGFLVRPALKQGEHAALLRVNVPDKIFDPPPYASATLTIPESVVVTPRLDVTVESPPSEARSTASDDAQ